MTLYLKYRPKNLDELDLTEVGMSLKKIVKSGRIPHALLFAGPKGTGKTSAARILAKILNCERLQGTDPCNECGQCTSITNGNNLDVVEMDAASHRGIDDVRTLRDAVKLAPLKAKKKVYIIDEAHMLTTEASNALLKTLEEPPTHVIFMLATTNPEKLLDTIRSRTTYIPFQKAKIEEIIRSLRRVADGEKLKVDDGALAVIAEFAGGAFRDAIKILEQIISEDRELTKEVLSEYLFSKKAFDLDGFLTLLLARDVKSLIEEIGKLAGKGVSTEDFLTALLTKLRTLLLIRIGVVEGEKSKIEKDDLVNLIEELSEAARNLADSPIEELPLEIAVIKWCEGGNREHLQTAHEEKNSHSGAAGESKVRTTSAAIEDINKTSGHTDKKDAQTISPSIRSQSDSPLKGGLENVNDEIWRSILALIKPINASVEALLRAARPVAYDGKVLTLGVYYKFHKERLEDAQHRIVLEDVVGRVLGSATKVVCTLTEPQPKKIVEEAKVESVLTEGKDTDIINVAEEIFGN